MRAIFLPITLLAIMAASSASPVPTDIEEDYSNIGYLSHPEGDMVLYRVEDEENELWNDMVEADEPRHLEKRSPIPFFDPLSLKFAPVNLPFTLKQLPFDKKVAKKVLKKYKKPKLIKKKVLFSPLIKKGAKKLAIVGVPTAALAGGTGLAGFALTSSLPALPALPAIPALGGLGAAGAGAGLTNVPPFFPIPPLQPQQNRN